MMAVELSWRMRYGSQARYFRSGAVIIIYATLTICLPVWGKFCVLRLILLDSRQVVEEASHACLSADAERFKAGRVAAENGTTELLPLTRPRSPVVGDYAMLD